MATVVITVESRFSGNKADSKQGEKCLRKTQSPESRSKRQSNRLLRRLSSWRLLPRNKPDRDQVCFAEEDAKNSTDVRDGLIGVCFGFRDFEFCVGTFRLALNLLYFR